jgi:hypothetical protein
MGEAQLDGAYLVQSRVLARIESDPQRTQVVVEPSEAANPDGGRCDGWIQKRPGESYS